MWFRINDSLDMQMPPKACKFILRGAHEEDYLFAKDLYIQTMKPLLSKLDAWDEVDVLSKFDGYYKTEEVQVVSIDGKDAFPSASPISNG